MGFQPGHKLAKGRPVGSKNKRTSLHDICEEKGINVFQEMLSLAITETDLDKRFHKLKEIAPYLYAKKKEVLNLEDISTEELLDVAEKKLTDESA